MSGFRCTIAAMTTAAAIGLMGAASAQQPTPPQPTFRTGINFVRVDVTVADRNGRPLEDLKAEDFEIIEAGRPQRIETFKRVTLDGGRFATGDDRPQPIRDEDAEAREAARDDVRLFAFFLDDYHVKRTSSLRIREQLARFMAVLGPSDMVGLMYPLDPIDAVLLTRNHDRIRDGLMHFEGRKYDYQPKNRPEQQYIFRVAADDVERIRNRVSFGALESLITHLGGLKEGRKSIVIVSEGYMNTLPPAMMAYDGGLGSATSSSPAQLGLPASTSFFQSLDLEQDLRDLTTLANRHNVSLYPLDPRGLATAEFGLEFPTVDRVTDRNVLMMSSNTLRTLAENTDGRALINRNEVVPAFREVVGDATGYYLLGYASTNSMADGKFHEITVRVKRPGVQVRHRKGYWALKAEEVARMAGSSRPAAPSPVETALTAAAQSSRIVRHWMGLSPGANGQARVSFVWEPVQRTPSRDEEPPAAVSLSAIAGDGSALYRGRVPRSSIAGQATRVTFAAPPGDVRVQLTIEGANGELLDRETRTLSVPDLTGPGPLLMTPAVFRTRTAAEATRIRNDRDPVPTPARSFSRTERLLVRVPVTSATTALTLNAALLNRAGQTVAPVPVDRRSADAPCEINVPLAGLAEGDYGVRLTVSDGANTATAIVAFHAGS